MELDLFQSDQQVGNLHHLEPEERKEYSDDLDVDIPRTVRKGFHKAENDELNFITEQP